MVYVFFLSIPLPYPRQQGELPGRTLQRLVTSPVNRIFQQVFGFSFYPFYVNQNAGTKVMVPTGDTFLDVVMALFLGAVRDASRLECIPKDYHPTYTLPPANRPRVFTAHPPPQHAALPRGECPYPTLTTTDPITLNHRTEWSCAVFFSFLCQFFLLGTSFLFPDYQ